MSTSLSLLGLFSSSVAIFSLFTGFGVGTFLFPLFLFYFPLEEALAVSGMISLVQSSVEAFLRRKEIDSKVLFQFGTPALLTSALGALCFRAMLEEPPLHLFAIGLKVFALHPLTLVIGIFLLLSILLSMSGFRFHFPIEREGRFRALGGALNGLFAGISGQQGALRWAFLDREPISQEKKIATSWGIACFIDLARCLMYLPLLIPAPFVVEELSFNLIAILLGAFGLLVGRGYLRLSVNEKVRRTTATCLMVVAAMIAIGLLRK